jgi:hypothetical protein
MPILAFLLAFGECPSEDLESKAGFEGACNAPVVNCFSVDCSVGQCCPDTYPGFLNCFIAGPGGWPLGDEGVDWLLDPSSELPPSCLALEASAATGDGGQPVVSEVEVLRACLESRIEGCDNDFDFVSCEQGSSMPVADDPMCVKYNAFWDSLQTCIDKNGPQELVTGVCFKVFQIDDAFSCGPYTCKVWEDPSCLDEPY